MAKSNRIQDELRQQGAWRTFTGEHLREIAFPIGGIGTGCVSLGGWGQLRDWEIYNRPGKGNANPFSFFTLFARPHGGKAVTKVLQGPVMQEYGRGGHGYSRPSGSGLPHFRECEFSALYPFATVKLRDRAMPLRAELTAFNPLIPHNDRDSSIPCAIFQWTIKNPTRKTVDATLLANLSNTIGHPQTGKVLNRFRRTPAAGGLMMTTRQYPEDSPRYGTMALATPHKQLTHLVHWRRGGWFDACTDFWSQATTGKLDESVRAGAVETSNGEPGSIGARFVLKPGESKTIPVVIAWLMPTAECGKTVTYRTYAGTQWKDAWAVVQYVADNLPRLERETRLYADTLAATTLPGPVVEAVAANSSILKSPTCIRLANGDFWAWEGCHDATGCCSGTCTHVWNYQQTLPYLFPALERNVRETDYGSNLYADGAMTFRLPLPLQDHSDQTHTGHPAADGQLGGILKVYREWRICGDDAWLARLWPGVKQSLAFARKHWDPDGDGVMEGAQHNTYDIEFWGPNTMTGSFYLGALRAAEEMAYHLGDEPAAEEYRALFESGSRLSDATLFNGEYYVQNVDRDAWKVGAKGRRRKPAPKTMDGKHPKYQYGSGCLSDQLLGQLFAEMLELGDLYNGRHIDKAADSIFKHNFKTSFFDHANPQRVYALDDEAGLLLCSWPKGDPERFPFPYSDEVWTGIEYATAALLAYRGRVDEALAIVKAARDRYDGVRRNPYDEVECGHHYARAMASYAVLLALSGFAADLPNGRLRFAPRINEENFATFFSAGQGWGLYSRKMTRGRSTHTVDVRYGSMDLHTLSLGHADARKVKTALNGKPLGAALAHSPGGVDVVLERTVSLRPGAALRVTLS